MEIDFSALASRVAAFSDVLGCIILSTDGLVLGSFPPGDEDGIKPTWLKFAQLGEPQRGFVKFSDDEVWAYASVGSYGAFAVATGTTRPGVLLDHLEQALLVAGESRDALQMARAPEQVVLAGGRPKVVAAPPQVAPSERMSGEEPQPAEAEVELETPRGEEPSHEHVENQGSDGNWDNNQDQEHNQGREHERREQQEERPVDEEGEVDRVVLAREFAGLLQEDPPGDEEDA